MIPLTINCEPLKRRPLYYVCTFRAYGVLLWEMFSLGQSPYPHLEAGPEFIQAILEGGERLPKPELAPDEIFVQVMLECWHEEPAHRPSFELISQTILEVVDIDRRTLPTFDEKVGEKSTSLNVGTYLPLSPGSVDNELYWAESDSVRPGDKETDHQGYLLTTNTWTKGVTLT